MTSSPERIAVAVIRRVNANSDGEYLVGVRQADQTLAGFHEFPGGRIRPGESVSDAAVRECVEETGVEVRAVETLCVTQHEYEFGLLELHFVLCRPHGDRPPRSPFGWLAAARLEVDRFPAANRAVLERLWEAERKHGESDR